MHFLKFESSVEVVVVEIGGVAVDNLSSRLISRQSSVIPMIPMIPMMRMMPMPGDDDDDDDYYYDDYHDNEDVMMMTIMMMKITQNGGDDNDDVNNDVGLTSGVDSMLHFCLFCLMCIEPTVAR